MITSSTLAGGYFFYYMLVCVILLIVYECECLSSPAVLAQTDEKRFDVSQLLIY